MYKFTGFTQKANTALNDAIESAENLGHTYIGSEHLLVGLLGVEGSVAHTVLTSKGVTLKVSLLPFAVISFSSTSIRLHS